MRIFKLTMSAAAFSLVAIASAQAADVVFEEPTAPVAPAPVAAYDWNGAYVGAFAGGATGDATIDYTYTGAPASNEAKSDLSGFLGGLQAGYDVQFDQLVVGVRGSVAYSTVKAKVTLDGTTDVPLEDKLTYLATAGARVGFALDRFLPYVHGGAAFGSSKASYTTSTETKLDDVSKIGWTAGVGGEYALTDTVSIGAEYGYVDLGKDKMDFAKGATLASTLGAANLSANEDLTLHTFKASVNYRF
ncbi:outer membrane protein [Aureimonas frigidaquae]|uniref:outer membrane protein n=1 Tax=Aureimonas frigidaquae TaxID=424757 RepID=UPI000784249D|nr:outer membrane protein [Aureimonas frigidaquae]